MALPHAEPPREESLGAAGVTDRRPLSMHEGIAAWCDCCSCEAEPYWVAVAEELGVDLGSDYEDGRAQ